MNKHCQPLPPQVAEELLQVVTRAICDRPADSAAQRESRTRQMIHSVLGFEPRDGLEYMLSTIAFGHFQLILDSMRDVFQGLSDEMKAKNKTTIVGLDRMMLQMIKELSRVRRRPMAYSGAGTAEDARAAAASPVGATMTAEPINTGVASEAVVAARPAASMPATSATMPPEPEETRADAARPDADVARSGMARSGVAPSDASWPAGTPPGFAAFARQVLALTGVGADEHGEAAMSDASADGIATCLAPPSIEEDTGTFEDHIAAFEDAYAATMETLAEARALELANTKVASGD